MADLQTAEGLQEYINENITNNAAKAFTERRLNNAMLATVELIKKVDDNAGSSTFRDVDL